MAIKKCSLISLVIVLIGIMAFVGGSSPAQAAADTPAKTLTIGTLLQLSDWYSVVDAGEQGDCEIVAQIINDRGGLTIKGQKYKVELAIEDGKSSLDGNTAAANKLVLDDKVKFVIGPSAFFSAASSPIFEAAKVIHVSGYCTLQPGELGSTTPYGFLGFDTAIPQQHVSLTALKKEFPNVKNIVLVTFDDGSLKYLAPRLKKMVADMGFNLIGDVVSFAQEMQDYSPIAAKLNAIAKADAYVIVIATPPMQTGIMKGVRTLGNQKPITATMPAADVLAMGGQIAANNIIATCTYTPNKPWNPPLIDEVYKRGKAGRRWFGMTPNALWILAQVIQAADSLDPDVVKAKWESMKTVSTIWGEGVMSGNETFGLKGHAITHPLPYAKIVNGVITDRGWVTPQPTP